MTLLRANNDEETAAVHQRALHRARRQRVQHGPKVAFTPDPRCARSAARHVASFSPRFAATTEEPMERQICVWREKLLVTREFDRP